jgi:formylglycine-generating enzyme required for sulfatase activity
MPNVSYQFSLAGVSHSLDFVFIDGTGGQPYRFGSGPQSLDIEIEPFYLSRTPVTQAIRSLVMGGADDPACHLGARLPLENVSWDQITAADGFFSRLNASPLGEDLRKRMAVSNTFRLTTETEWEYAARGGPHWRDGYEYSGSNQIDAVAWFKDNSGNQTHEVGLKAANQLGLHDLCGNVWEWCQDRYTPHLSRIPRNGAAFEDDGDDRVLRGGCHHNWAVHCTVHKRYAITPTAHDGCIGFRIALGG